MREKEKLEKNKIRKSWRESMKRSLKSGRGRNKIESEKGKEIKRKSKKGKKTFNVT